MADHQMLTMTTDLPCDLLKIIGQIAVAYGQLEHALAMSIKRTTPGISIEDALELAESFSARRELATQRFGIWYQDQNLEGKFEKAIDHAREVAKRRHDVMHALWAKNGDNGVCWLRLGWYNAPDLAELQSIRDDIYRTAMELNGATRNDGVIIFDAETTAASSYRISWKQ